MKRLLLFFIAAGFLASCREKPIPTINLAAIVIKFPDESSAKKFDSGIHDAALSADFSKRFSQLYGKDVKVTISHDRGHLYSSFNVQTINADDEEAHAIGKALKQDLEIARSNATSTEALPAH